MATTSRSELISTAQTFTTEHDCPYAEQIIRTDEQRRAFGSHGMSLLTLEHLVAELGTLHADDTCPPTHVDNYPTTEWAEWVKDVRV